MAIVEYCYRFYKDSTACHIYWKTRFVTRNHAKALPASDVYLYHIFVRKITTSAFGIACDSFRGRNWARVQSR
jgi:hypothetical protein